jgi:hypothetical protein
MPQIQINPRWRAQIEGEPDDIADLKRVLNGSARTGDSFFVVDWDDKTPTLTTTIWDNMSDGRSVALAAAAALKLYGGILDFFDGCRPLTVGTIFEVAPGGHFNQQRTTTFQLLVKPPQHERVSPEVFAQMVALSNEKDWLLSVFLESGSPPDWYSIYHAIEAIERACGGTEFHMKSSPHVDGKWLKEKAKRQANFARHLPGGKHVPPDPPVGLDEAKQALKAAVLALISAEV